MEPDTRDRLANMQAIASTSHDIWEHRARSFASIDPQLAELMAATAADMRRMAEHLSRVCR